jgi:hypothetical protein
MAAEQPPVRARVAAAVVEDADEGDQFHDARPPPAAADPAMVNDLGRAMAEAVRVAMQQVQANKDATVPVPVFDGEGDVELFIKQF